MTTPYLSDGSRHPVGSPPVWGLTGERAARGAEPRPDRAGVVLVALILVAAVANLNPPSVANVALPSIGQAFDSSQVTLNLIAVGYSLGLAGVGALPRRHR